MLKPYQTAGILEAGCDEAGRGCLAGDVYAAAVILPPDFSNELLNDSNPYIPTEQKSKKKIKAINQELALSFN